MKEREEKVFGWKKAGRSNFKESIVLQAENENG